MSFERIQTTRGILRVQVQIKDDKSEKAAVAANLKPRKEKQLHGPADE